MVGTGVGACAPHLKVALVVLGAAALGYITCSSSRPKKAGGRLVHSDTSKRRMGWLRLAVSVFGLTLTIVRTT